MGLGVEIRDFFRELFGSRLVERLEIDLLHLRQDFESRLHDKENAIAGLRSEKAVLEAKIMLYEQSIMPTASRLGADIVAHQKPKKPNFGVNFKQPPPTKTRWQQVQEDHNKQLAEDAQREQEAAQSA